MPPEKTIRKTDENSIVSYLMCICRAMNRTVRAGLFPAALFQNGHTFFVQRAAQTMGHQPYAVHASYVPGKAVKVHHFREALLWHVRLSSSVSLMIQ